MFEAAGSVVVMAVVVICMVATRTLPNAQSAMLPQDPVLTRMSRDSELEPVPLLLHPPPPIVPHASPPTHAEAAAVSVVGPVGPEAAGAADEGVLGAGGVKGGTAKKRVWR